MNTNSSVPVGAAANGFWDAACRLCRPYRGWLVLTCFDPHGSRRGLIAIAPTGASQSKRCQIDNARIE